MPYRLSFRQGFDGDRYGVPNGPPCHHRASAKGVCRGHRLRVYLRHCIGHQIGKRYKLLLIQRTRQLIDVTDEKLHQRSH